MERGWENELTKFYTFLACLVFALVVNSLS